MFIFKRIFHFIFIFLALTVVVVPTLFFTVLFLGKLDDYPWDIWNAEENIGNCELDYDH